jgi:hypothetical protein
MTGCRKQLINLIAGKCESYAFFSSRFHFEFQQSTIVPPWRRKTKKGERRQLLTGLITGLDPGLNARLNPGSGFGLFFDLRSKKFPIITLLHSISLWIHFRSQIENESNKSNQSSSTRSSDWIYFCSQIKNESDQV